MPSSSASSIAANIFVAAATTHPALINGAAGVVITTDERVVSVMGFTVRNGKVVEIDSITDPDRLLAMDVTDIDR